MAGIKKSVHHDRGTTSFSVSQTVFYVADTHWVYRSPVIELFFVVDKTGCSYHKLRFPVRSCGAFS